MINIIHTHTTTHHQHINSNSTHCHHTYTPAHAPHSDSVRTPDYQAAKAASHVGAHEHSCLRREPALFKQPALETKRRATSIQPSPCNHLLSFNHPSADTHLCNHKQSQITKMPPSTQTHTHTHARTTSPHTLTHKGADHRALRFSTPIVGCAAFVCFLVPLLGAGGGMGKRVTCSWFQLLRRQPRC